MNKLSFFYWKYPTPPHNSPASFDVCLTAGFASCCDLDHSPNVALIFTLVNAHPPFDGGKKWEASDVGTESESSINCDHSPLDDGRPGRVSY